MCSKSVQGLVSVSMYKNYHIVNVTLNGHMTPTDWLCMLKY